MRTFLTSIAILSAAYTAAAESTPVTGIIVDEKGEPLIGVTVKVNGAPIGTSTDLDGKFSIILPKAKGELTFSYVGYSTFTKKVTDGENLATIKMEPTTGNLDEVVVIGYGVAKKSSLTSSVEVISGDELTKIPAMNVDQALAGTMPGLGVMSTSGDPSSGSEAKMAIRGNTNNPLLVIDGVPRLGTNTSDGEMRLSDLNPDDIESVSVLKDAAAAAVYGARAANGVILVQTKRGKEGGKARVNFRGQFNVQEATYLPKFLDSYRFAELYNRAVEASESSIYTPYDLDLIGTNPNLYGNENLLDHLDKWGHSQRYSLSVSGGTKAVRYFVSGGYTNNKGLYANVSRDRYNYGVKLDADIFKGMMLQVDLNGSVSNNKNSSYTTIDAAYSYSPLQVLRFTDGNLASIDGSNPLINVYGLGGYNKVNTDYHTLNAQLSYEIPGVKGLKVYLKGTLDLNHQNTQKYSKPVPLYIWNEETGTSSVDPKTVYPSSKIKMEDRWQKVNNKLIEVGVNYNRTFADKHEVTGLLVANYQDYNNKYLNGINNDLPGEYPEIIGNTSTGTINGSEYYSQRASVVGRATYGYDSRYFGEFSFRVDG
ncbi:MAG: SusC/RagA family TonB-linked outer membrane protein, partial [Muribaculaceae bacterium]|nr:SusC/RagA family TonB-linked outer membrane protein [Muribaculaceae bacterium]